MNRSEIPAGKGKKNRGRQPPAPISPKNNIKASTEGRKHSPHPPAVGLYGLGLHCSPLGAAAALAGSAIAPPLEAAFPWAASLPSAACIAGSVRSSSHIGFYIRMCERLHIQSIYTPPY